MIYNFIQILKGDNTMLIFFTHNQIGKNVFNDLELSKHFGASGQKYFVRGNYLPDVSYKYKITKHYPDKSWDVVYKLIRQLETGELKEKDFLKTLGILNHYLCDFFCTAHNENPSVKNLFSHFIYEIKIHISFMHNEFKPLFNIVDTSNKLVNSKTSLFDFIKECHEEYLTKEKSTLVDLTYAISMCMLSVKYIVSLYSNQNHIGQIA